MRTRNIVKLFSSRKGHLNYRAKRDYVRNGVVTIPCKINDYNEIISSYSVKGYETLEPDFVDYLMGVAEVTPAECPLVINIVGDSLKDDEKKTIERIIVDDFNYDLGLVEKEEKRHTRIFFYMIIALIIFGIAMWLTEPWAEVPRELVFILFWFAGETLCDYIFLTGHDLRRDRKLAGRLASIKVVFSDTYEDYDITDDDVEELYEEIEKDVNKTIEDA